MPSLTFGHVMAYGPPGQGGQRSGVGTRAYVWFEIVNPQNGMRSRRIFGLLDSGCDVALLDQSLLGPGLLGLAPGRPVSIGVAGGGNLTGRQIAGAEIEIEGVRVSGLLLVFGQFATGATPLIGRQAYLNAFDVAFTAKDWLHS